MLFKFFLLFTLSTMDFFHPNLLKIYSEKNLFNYFIILFVYQNKLVCFRKLLPFNIRSINPIQKYPHIIESYSINISHDIFVSSEFLNLF